MISQESGEVFLWMFLLLEDSMGHLHPYIITSSSQASLPGEIKSSMPCSRDIMNSNRQENKPPVSRREDTIKKNHKGIFSKESEGRSVPCGSLLLQGSRGQGSAALQWLLDLTHLSPVPGVVQLHLILPPKPAEIVLFFLMPVLC